MDNICQICHQLVQEDSHFWKSHKIKRADYYEKYYPKFDLLTKEKISFKTLDTYEFSDFLNKRNLANWVKLQPQEKAREYCKNLLIKRKEKKNLIYSPGQIELRTLPMPSIITYNQLFGDYHKLCEEIGLKNKYKKADKLTFCPCEYSVQVDSREQKPLIFKYFNLLVKKLDFGDYLLQSSNNYVFFERKSLADFIQTHSEKGLERFRRELTRAKELHEHLIIIVEEKFDNALAFQYLPHISKKVRVTPDFIMKNVRDIIQDFPNVQYVFTDGRPRAVEVMEKILFMGPIYKELDLQLLYESKLL